MSGDQLGALTAQLAFQSRVSEEQCLAAARVRDQHLIDLVMMAADRCADVAAILRGKDGYDPANFLEATSERLRNGLRAIGVAPP